MFLNAGGDESMHGGDSLSGEATCGPSMCVWGLGSLSPGTPSSPGLEGGLGERGCGYWPGWEDTFGEGASS